MAALLTDPKGRSPFFYCQYRCGDGRWLKKSTKIKIKPDKGEKRKDGSPKSRADKRAEAWEVCLRFQEAEDLGKNGLFTQEHAKKILDEILQRTTGERLNTYKARDWFAHWLEQKEQVRAGKTLERYRQVVRDFVESLGRRADLSLAHISSKDVLAYRKSVIDSGKRARTANLSIKVISAAFNAAVRQHVIDSNPATALESLKVRSDEKGTFTPRQVSALVAEAQGDDWKNAILFGYFTGARLSDIANMKWEAINWNKKLIRFVASKTGKQVLVPLHPELERALLKSAGIGSAPMFPALAGKGTGGRYGLSGQFSAIMEKAGIEGKLTEASGGRTLSSLSFHSLRHSFNSALANRGVPQEIRQKLTGHATAAMNEIYSHHEIETLRAAVAQLPEVTTPWK
jgi:integrase